MRLIDLDAGIAPMIDENRKATVGEFLGLFFEQLPPIIDAIPVEWLNKKYAENEPGEDKDYDRYLWDAIEYILTEWQKEQEAR